MPLIGGGFKDMVRIAGSNPEMWVEIVETNRDNILSSISKYKLILEEMEDLIKDSNKACTIV